MEPEINQPQRPKSISAFRPAQSGFTLLEILVVVTIVGVMASFAILSIPGSDFNDELEREARKISAQVSLLQDEAIVSSRELGVEFWSNGYRFWGWTVDAGWLPISNDDDFKPHVLPEGSELTLNVNGQPLPLSLIPTKGFPSPKPLAQNGNTSGTAPKPDFKHNLPAVLLFSSGEATPFEAELEHPEAQQRWKITGNPIGRLSLASQVVDR